MGLNSMDIKTFNETVDKDITLNSYIYYINKLKKSFTIYKYSFIISSIINIILLLFFLLLYISGLTKPKVIPYVIFMDDKTLAYYKLGTMSNIKDVHSDNVLKLFVKNYVKYFRSVPLDNDVVQEYIHNLNIYTDSKISPLINKMVNDDKIYDFIGVRYRTIDIVSLLLVDKNTNSYLIEWYETTYGSNGTIFKPIRKDHIKATIKLSLGEMTVDNPLGIYVVSYDYNILESQDKINE
jgi:type IV secretory pathway TrbF-like protein